MNKKYNKKYNTPPIKRSKYTTNADFTEDYVCCSIDVYFSFLDCFQGIFWVEPISRQKESEDYYDAVLKANKAKKFKPFYMQYKLPIEYESMSISPIVKFRKKNNLTKECFAFPIYNRIGNSQHNGLYELGQHHHAAYVCPLYIERESYRQALNKSLAKIFKLRSFRFSIGTKILHKRDVRIYSISKLFKTFFIHEHICIPPHEDVPEGEKHQYSFLKDGTNVCFHSGKILENISQRLDKWLISIVDKFNESEKVITEDTSESEFYDILERLGEHATNSFKIEKELRDRNPKDKIKIENWLWLGKYLREEYGIYQYGLFEGKEGH